jgi:hypothetical protein
MTDNTTPVAWHRRDEAAISAPIVRDVPYVEVKLEHPDLEPTGQLDRFYPDGVPYGRGPDARMFFWRPVLQPGGPEPGDWIGAVATTHGLGGIANVPAAIPPLVDDEGSGMTAIVDGTVVGDAQTVLLRRYDTPSVRVTQISSAEVTISIDGTDHSIATGNRRQISLSDRDVTYADEGRTTSISPVVSVRYPGVRTLYHPAVGSADRLFPSFGLDLETVPNPIPVPTHGDELNHEALADLLDVDRSDRPYAERVLWQAFAFTAFDPHGETTPSLGQTSDGLLVLAAAEDE